jgi:multisubunit Na+/H+ antiporter MnhC subunit
MNIVDKVNENHGAFIVSGIAVALICLLAWVLPNTLSGMNYIEAIGDSLGLRITKLALFDLHAVGVLYLYGGKSWSIVRLFKTKPVSTALLLTAILIGSALMLM